MLLAWRNAFPVRCCSQCIPSTAHEMWPLTDELLLLHVLPHFPTSFLARMLRVSREIGQITRQRILAVCPILTTTDHHDSRSVMASHDHSSRLKLLMTGDGRLSRKLDIDDTPTLCMPPIVHHIPLRNMPWNRLHAPFQCSANEKTRVARSSLIWSGQSLYLKPRATSRCAPPPWVHWALRIDPCMACFNAAGAW